MDRKKAGAEGERGENVYHETDESEISRVWFLEIQRGMESKTAPEISGEVQAEAKGALPSKLERGHDLPADKAQ